MWPLLVCFVAALVVLAERSLAWASLARRSDGKVLHKTYDAIVAGDFAKAERLCNVASDPFLQTIHVGLAQAHVSFLGAMQLEASRAIERADKRLWLLATFITLAPLLGLLGTVTGIKESFDVLGNAEVSSHAKITGGIAEALIATAGGLFVAISCLIPYNYFNRCLAHFRLRLERVINHVELLAESARQNGFEIQEFSRGLMAKRAAAVQPASSI
jgi:biopolymer transport protein ExbB